MKLLAKFNLILELSWRGLAVPPRLAPVSAKRPREEVLRQARLMIQAMQRRAITPARRSSRCW